MNREQAETLLAVLVADELDEPVRGELLAYLKTDAELAERVGDMRAAARLARAALEGEQAETPASLGDERRAVLLSLAEREPIQASPAVSDGPSPSTTPSILFTFRAAGAAAACVAMGVGLIGLALPDLGEARYALSPMADNSESMSQGMAPGSTYGYNTTAGDAENYEDSTFQRERELLLRRPQTQGEIVVAERAARERGDIDRAVSAALDEVTGTLAEDLAQGSDDFFESAAPTPQSPRTSGLLADARSTNDRITRDASPMLESPAVGQSLASVHDKPSDDWVGSVVWGDNHVEFEAELDYDTRYGSADLGEADGDGYAHLSDLTGRILTAEEGLEGLFDPSESTRGLGASPPPAPPDPAEADGWAYDNGVTLGLPVTETPAASQPGSNTDFRRDSLSFVDGGETDQEDPLSPGLAGSPEGFDIGGGFTDSFGQQGQQGLPSDGLPDNGSNWDPVTVTGNTAPADFATAPAFDLNEALANNNLPGENGGGGGGRGGGGGGGLFGDDSGETAEADPLSFGIELPMEEVPDVSRGPSNDLLAQARRQRAQDKIDEAEEAFQNGQQHLARELYEEAALLNPDDAAVGDRLSELRDRATNSLRPVDPLSTVGAELEIVRQETGARYEQAMQRAEQARANGEYDAALDAVIEARTLLNANRSAFGEPERQALVSRAAELQSGINTTRNQEEASRLANAERAQHEAESSASIEATDRRDRQVQERLQNARALQLERRYDEALDELEAAQFIDPQNTTLQTLHDLILDVQVGTEARRLRRELDLMRSNQQLINDEAIIPNDELLTYPGEWPELTQMRLAGLEDSEGESAANRTAQLAMRRILTLNVEDQSLQSVIDYLRDTTGANIAINWPALELSGVTADTPVSISLARVPAEQLLKLVLEQAGAASVDDDKPGYTIVEGIVQVSTLADLKTATQVALYDIRALFAQRPAEEHADFAAELMQLIQDTVGDPDEWLDEGSTLRELHGNLIVKTTPENHRELVALIERLGYDAQQPEEDPAETPAIPPVNPWVLTEHDAQSTFALDTDTASYELARRTITEQAQLPAIASVRMEEFVNRFDYQYPAGRDAHDTFTVHAEAGEAPFAEDGVVLVKVGVRGRVVARDQMKPAHYVFVIDASGSMAREDRLPLVRQSLAMLLGQLGERDTVSLVSYDTRPFLLLDHAPASDARAILDAAATIQTGGSTNLSDGLRLGYQVAARHFAPGAVNRVILCSDGVANVGDDDAQQMLDAAETLRRQGVTLMTVGVGVDGQTAAAQAEGSERFNDGLLEQLANRGDGRYVYLGSVADAQRQLVEDLAATRPTIAYDAKVQVVFDPSRVRRYRLIGYENRDIADRDFRNDAVDAGEVGSGQSATALYEVELYPTPGRAGRGASIPGQTAGGDLGSVFVRYRDAETDQVRETETPLLAGIVQERTVRDDPRFYLAACAAEFAELLRESPHAKDGSFARLHRLARQVAEALPLDRDAAALADLIGRSNGLPRAGQ